MARIIIAEDDEIVAAVLQAKLMDAGHAVGIIDNGADALSVISQKLPDLVILDCNMPGMQGVEVVREMRKSDEMWGIPVLMLTGRRGTTDMQLAMYAGADDYATKPFDPDAMVFRVQELLRAHSSGARDRRA